MSPSPLETLQRRFVRSVTFAPDPAFVAAVSGGGSLTAARAVEVHRRAYAARLSEALGETYEGCWRVLGDERFLRVAQDYIARFPSVSHNLSDYGEGFPQFLESGEWIAAAPFLGDLARLEWAFKGVFHARAHRGLEPAELVAAAGDGRALALGAAAVLLAFKHRVRDIWARDRCDSTPLKPSDWDGAQNLVLYKAGGNEVFTKELSGAQFAALRDLARGRPLADALDSAGLDEAGAAALFSFAAEARLFVMGGEGDGGR